jgi:cell division septation protein DedD
MKLEPHDDDRLWRESETTSWFRFSSPLRYVIFILILIAVLIGLWYLIAPTRQWYNKADLPLIRADQAPYKIKVAHQGVPSVKHQDKLVYGRIRADENGPITEHILPDPEAPLIQLTEQDPPLKMVEQYAPDDMDLEKTAESPKKKQEPGILSAGSIEELLEEIPEEKKVSEPKGKAFIQLGSLKSYEMAEAEWNRLSKKHPDTLGGLEPLIQKVDLGEEQGIYYRLRTGPFESATKVSEICAHLKAQKVECVVVK